MQPNSLWQTEPAKMVGWLVAATIAVAAVLIEVLNEVTGVLPDSWQPKVRAVVATVTLVSLIATRIQAVLTRNGIGPPGKVFDGVYAPATVQFSMAPSPEDMLHGGVGPKAITPVAVPEQESPAPSNDLGELARSLGIEPADVADPAAPADPDV